jgi:hypothetical protein
VARCQGSTGLPVQGSQRIGLATRPRTRDHRVGCPSRAASAPMSSGHAHAWLHWPKLSVAQNTNRGRGHAIVKRLHKLPGQGHATYFACAHQPNCRFNSDVNASHCRRLTWALGFLALHTNITPMKTESALSSYTEPYTGHQVCPELAPRFLCFCVREYRDGPFHTVFHQHVPAHRISQERAHEALRSLVARHSDWSGDWVLNSLLNRRGREPECYPGFTHDVSYPEAGVLRHTVSASRVHAWCDTIISKQAFRTASSAEACQSN